MKKLIIAKYDGGYDWAVRFDVNKRESITYYRDDYDKRNQSSDYKLPKPLDKIAFLIEMGKTDDLLDALKQPEVYERYNLILICEDAYIQVLKG